jgi:hypothetical protein
VCEGIHDSGDDVDAEEGQGEQREVPMQAAHHEAGPGAGSHPQAGEDAQARGGRQEQQHHHAGATCRVPEQRVAHQDPPETAWALPPDHDALLGALAGACTDWSSEELALVEVLLEDDEDVELELEVVAGWLAVLAVPGMVAAAMPPKTPTAATPPAAVHSVSRRTLRRPLSRADPTSWFCSPNCMSHRLPSRAEAALRLA